MSAFAERAARELGPVTPVLGRFGGEDFVATDPLALARARSRFELGRWRVEARAGARKVVGEIDAPHATLAGVTLRHPDGRAAYCYNSEVASMRLFVWDRVARGATGGCCATRSWRTGARTSSSAGGTPSRTSSCC